MTDKEIIIERFNKNIKGKPADTSTLNQDHDGKIGHWVEKMLGVIHNKDMKPDLFGYEIKTGKVKMSWIDKVADDYILDRVEFVTAFGSIKKGKKEDTWTEVNILNDGQNISVINKSICVCYNYSKDPREDKSERVPENLRDGDIIIAIWDKETLKKHIEDKFGSKGTVFVERNNKDVFTKLTFRDPIDYNKWLEAFKKGLIRLDFAMSKKGRKRNLFRSNKTDLNKIYE